MNKKNKIIEFSDFYKINSKIEYITLVIDIV